MGLFDEQVVRPRLFRQEAEHAHETAVRALARLGRLGPLCRLLESWARLPAARFRPVGAFGLKFPNAVGLAAGFDKNATAWPAAAALGFGHVEAGTITALAQPGNDRPRMFRYPAQQAVINRMGFNNDGAAAVGVRLDRLPGPGRRRIPLGLNLGKSKAAAPEQAVADYLESFAQLADHADYVVLNVSSPNTPGLRALQDEKPLRELLGAVTLANRARAAAPGGRRVPLLLKIAPDLIWPQIDAVLGVIAEFGLDGIIATQHHPGAARLFFNRQPGRRAERGAAPPPRDGDHRLHRPGDRRPAADHRRGGHHRCDGAAEKLDAGAVLVQVYTGMIFRGPFFARDLAWALADRQRR